MLVTSKLHGGVASRLTYSAIGQRSVLSPPSASDCGLLPLLRESESAPGIGRMTSGAGLGGVSRYSRPPSVGEEAPGSGFVVKNRRGAGCKHYHGVSGESFGSGPPCVGCSEPSFVRCGRWGGKAPARFPRLRPRPFSNERLLVEIRRKMPGLCLSERRGRCCRESSRHSRHPHP